MSRYTEPGPWAEHVEGIEYRVRLPLVWEIGIKGSKLFFTVPAGAPFDVSVPRPLRWAFDPHDPRFLKAAALHDEMLRCGWNRVTAGAVFNEALRADRVGSGCRFVMWLAVSVFKWK